MSEFRVPPSKKKRFFYYFKDGTKVSHVGYFYWESPDYKALLSLGIQKITYTLDYKEE